MSAEDNLRALGIVLPDPPPAAGTYVGGIRSGTVLRMSGCGPRLSDGTYIRGKLGAGLTVEQGYAAARQAGLVALGSLRAQVGTLARVRRLLRVVGMINASPDFEEHPKVLNGFSDLMVEVFEANGLGARTAVGMSSLTKGMAIEVLATWEVAE